MQHAKHILIIDFGSQYTQLIARRVRELQVFSRILPWTGLTGLPPGEHPAGIILSGGPMSVLSERAPTLSAEIFAAGIPLLGICYGMQLIAKQLGGVVRSAENREYGNAVFTLEGEGPLTTGMPASSSVWMSHGDHVEQLPAGFTSLGSSPGTRYCAMADSGRKIFGVQFHPEVAHTAFGKQLLKNFVLEICGCTADWTPGAIIAAAEAEARAAAESGAVLCALSGGVDSTVAAVLLHRALGNRLLPVHINTGLMRKGESEQVIRLFQDELGIAVRNYDASELFLSRLAGITEPEQKRKIIGAAFIEVFEQITAGTGANYLVQGTLYPDVIESVPVHGSSAVIKSHHNVGGLPEKMKLRLLEPFRELFKDEVRAIGYALGIPESFIQRHPFPGPGLAVRIPGEVTPEKVALLQEVDSTFIALLQEYGVYQDIWQAFAVLLPVRAVGVMGDARTYEYAVALRAVTSVDGMTADWYRFEPNLLAAISTRLLNTCSGINRVLYDVTSKPPGTIEWE